MAIALLPSFFVLQATSGSPYLSVPEDLPASLPLGFLKFQEKQIWSPHAKFKVEQAETGDGTLVHIRSCYNNKYWVVHKINNDYWVAASANEPNEDQTDPACTLFQPQLGDKGVHLFSIGMSMYATTSGGDTTDITDGLQISDSKLSFNVVDWETLAILPSQVSFRSEAEGKYLCCRVLEAEPLLRFESGLEAEDPLVVHELVPTADGNYRIKDLSSGKFWRESPSKWILDDGEEKENDSVFSFVKISDGVFAIRSLGSNNFCGMDTSDEKTDCLNAAYQEISRETRLIVEERVVLRDILNLSYRLSDSRIYNKETVEVSHAFASNNTETESVISLNFASSDPRTTKWTNSASVTSNVKVNLDVTIVPVIVNDGAVKLSNEPGRTYEWGVIETTKIPKHVTYNVVVPPLTTVKVTLGCMKATCDVPFSYTQRDLLVSGDIVITLKGDGIFTGINYYNFYVQTSEQGKNDPGRLSTN